MFGEVVLAGQSLDVWQGVDALVGSNFCQPVRGDAHVRPVDVPVCVFVRVAADVHLATHTLHHVVAAVLRAQHKARLSICACPLFLLLLEGDFAFGLGGAGWEGRGLIAVRVGVAGLSLQLGGLLLVFEEVDGLEVECVPGGEVEQGPILHKLHRSSGGS